MPAEIRRWVYLACIVVALIFVGLILAWCGQGRQDHRAAERTQAATGKALDDVAERTDTIREQQKEDEHAVDEISGADQRLPDNFGADLERLRRARDQHPR